MSFLNDRNVPLEERLEQAKQLFVSQPQVVIDWIFPLMQKLTATHEVFQSALLWDLLGMIFEACHEPVFLSFPNSRLPLRLPVNLVLLPFQRCPHQVGKYLHLLKPHAASLQPGHLVTLLKEAKDKECCVDLLVSMAKAMVPRRSFQLALEVLPLLHEERQVSPLFAILFTAEHVAELVNLIRSPVEDEKKRAYQADLLLLMRERHTGCLLKGLSPHLDRKVAFELFLQLDSPELIDAIKPHYQVRNDEVFHWQQAALKDMLRKHQTQECWMAMLSLDVHLILEQPTLYPNLNAEFWRLLWQESCKARQLPRLLPILGAHRPEGVFPFEFECIIPTPLILNTLLPLIPACEFGQAVACQLLWQSEGEDALLDQLEEMGGKLLLSSLLDRRPTARVLELLSAMPLEADLAVKVAHYQGNVPKVVDASCMVWPALTLDQRMRWLEEHGLTVDMLNHPRFPDLVHYPRLFLQLLCADVSWIHTVLMETPPECLREVPLDLLCKLPFEMRLQVMLRGNVHWDKLQELEVCPSLRQCLKHLPYLPASNDPKVRWMCQVEMARRGGSLTLPSDLSLIEVDDFTILAQHGLISQLSYAEDSPLWTAWMSYCDQIDMVRPHWKSLMKRYVYLIERDLSLEAMVAEVIVHPDPYALLTALMTHLKDRVKLELSARMAYQLTCQQLASVSMLHRLILLKGVWPIPDLLPLLQVMRPDEPGTGECLLALVNHYPHYYHPRILELVCGMLEDEVTTPKIVQQLASNQQCRWDLLGYPLILHALTMSHIPRTLEMSLFSLMSQMHSKEHSIWEHIHRLTKGPIERARWKRLHSEWKRTFVHL